MKRELTIAVAALAITAAGASAQDPPRDTAQRPLQGPMMRGRMQPGQSPEQLRARVEERWHSMVQNQLSLTDQQMDRLRTVERANQDRQRELDRREQDLMRGMRDQLQPGVAANNDSLSRSLDALAALRVQRAQSDQQVLRDLGFLPPVQRARYMMMARQFRERVQALQRGGPPAGMRPGQQRMQPGQPGMQQRPPRPGRPIEDDEL